MYMCGDFWGPAIQLSYRNFGVCGGGGIWYFTVPALVVSHLLEFLTLTCHSAGQRPGKGGSQSVCVCVSVCTCMHVCVCIVHAHPCVCMYCMYMHVRVCMHVCSKPCHCRSQRSWHGWSGLCSHFQEENGAERHQQLQNTPCDCHVTIMPLLGDYCTCQPKYHDISCFKSFPGYMYVCIVCGNKLHTCLVFETW